jgi:hypothetical protein
MSANWDYAQLARTASENGGPQKYLNDLKAGSKFEGRAQGLLVGAVIAGCVKGYDHWKKRKELAAIAESKLLEGMQAAMEVNGPAPDDHVDPAPDDDEVV